jgi:hypothetical protein
MIVATIFTLLVSLSASDQEACEHATQIPFTFASTYSIALSYTENTEFCVEFDGAVVNMGHRIPVFAKQLASGEFVFVARETPIGLLTIGMANDEGIQWLELPYEDRSRLHPEHLLVLGDRVFLAAYDVLASLPPGRRIDMVTEGVGLYELNRAGLTGDLELISELSWPSTIEGVVFDFEFEGGVGLCVAQNCELLRLDGRSLVSVSRVDISALAGFPVRIIEAISYQSGGALLVSVEFDDRLDGGLEPGRPVYFICQFAEVQSCEPVALGLIPYRLQGDDRGLKYDVIETPDDLSQLIRFDLERMRQTGVGTLGENNLEGRVAWSLQYYLHGLVSLGERFPAFQVEAATRAEVEVDQLARMYYSEFPNLFASRYSMNREPIRSLLHNARIGVVYERACRFSRACEGHNTQALIASSYTLPDIRRDHIPGMVVEELDERSSPSCPRFRIRRGMPFWADGSNVAWNYQSAWISAIALTQQQEVRATYEELARRMIGCFIEEERLNEQSRVWNYSSGLLTEGWNPEDRVSFNTPRYMGDQMNTQTAHISYRTMDMVALLAAHRNGVHLLDPQIYGRLLELIDEGLVWPFAMREAAEHGHLLNLDEAHLAYFARARLPYELENQVWALDQIQRELTGYSMRE